MSKLDGCRNVQLIGGPYLVERGRIITVPEGSKRLLAFVAFRCGRLERRHVAGVLWPECNDDRAAGNLRSSLWRLRGAGIDVIDCDKWSLRLREDVSVDVSRVREWADRVIGGRSREEDLDSSALPAEVLDLLPGWTEDWVVVERERLRQRLIHALEALSHELSSCGRHADAVESALIAAGAEPLRESAQRALVEAHLREGNWIEANRAVRAYRHLLRQELGVKPPHDIIRLVGESAPK